MRNNLAIFHFILISVSMTACKAAETYDSTAKDVVEIESFEPVLTGTAEFSKTFISFLPDSFRPEQNRIDVTEYQYNSHDKSSNSFQFELTVNDGSRPNSKTIVFVATTPIPTGPGFMKLILQRPSDGSEPAIGIVEYRSGQVPLIHALCTSFLIEDNWKTTLAFPSHICSIHIKKETGQIIAIKMNPVASGGNVVSPANPKAPTITPNNTPGIPFGNDMIYRVCGYLEYYLNTDRLGRRQSDSGVHMTLTELQSSTSKISVGEHYSVKSSDGTVNMIIGRIDETFLQTGNNIKSRILCVDTYLEDGLHGLILNIKALQRN